MKKVGICACYNTLNYGSMLQSLATQVAIERMGYESEFIIYKKKKTPLFLLKQIPRLFNKNLIYDKKLGIQKKIQLSFYPDIKKNNENRKEAFYRFQRKFYGAFSNPYYGYDELKAGAENYGSVVVGSDQLWTPGGLATNFYNLMFVPENINKVSYATSFGVSSIPKYQHKRTEQYLKRINFLSVREIGGAKIIKELANLEAKVVADPTLLLTREEWLEKIPNERVVDEPYIFCYFLGENEEHRQLAKELKQKTGLKIVTTPFLDSFVKSDINFGDCQLFDIGPDGFVNLIRNAEYILTDSFHGSIFSIINHKKFVTLNRFSNTSKQSRNSRIDSLCAMLDLDKRRYKENIYETMIAEIDYELVDSKVDSLRTDSLDYLAHALTEGK